MRVVRRLPTAGLLGVVRTPAVVGGLRFVGVAGTAAPALISGFLVGVTGAVFAACVVAAFCASACRALVRVAGPSYASVGAEAVRLHRLSFVPPTLGAAAVVGVAPGFVCGGPTLGSAGVSASRALVIDRVPRWLVKLSWGFVSSTTLGSAPRSLGRAGARIVF